MNSLTKFRLCTLSNEQLAEKVNDGIDEIYQTGEIPTRHIPAQPNNDFDLLVGELILRFVELDKKLKELSNSEQESTQIDGLPIV